MSKKARLRKARNDAARTTARLLPAGREAEVMEAAEHWYVTLIAKQKLPPPLCALDAFGYILWLAIGMMRFKTPSGPNRQPLRLVYEAGREVLLSDWQPRYLPFTRQAMEEQWDKSIQTPSDLGGPVDVTVTMMLERE